MLFSDYEINNYSSFIKSSKFLPPRERITFSENSSRGSWVVMTSMVGLLIMIGRFLMAEIINIFRRL